MNEITKVEGEVIAPGYKTNKPKMEVLQRDIIQRKANPPEMQYALMKAWYKDNTDVNAFVTSGEVSELIASVCFYRRPSDPTRWVTAPKFISGAELQGAVDAYFEIMFEAAEKGSELIPDTEHLYLFLGVTKNTIYKWKRENPEWADIFEDALNRVLVIKKQLAMHNKIPQLVYMSDIQNNHGYKQKDAKEEKVDERVIPNEAELIEKAKYLPG